MLYPQINEILHFLDDVKYFNVGWLISAFKYAISIKFGEK